VSSSAARERTRLAWRRTALSATVVGLLFVKVAANTGRIWLAALAVPGWLVVLAVTHHRLGSVELPEVELILLTVAVIGYALFGMGLVVLP
jgi:uncharacterized membrane protein YidH (DUF202 family)